jgi:hypothetical protein
MCISGNGKVAGGWVQGNNRLPYIWNPDSLALQSPVGEVHGINYDGSRVVGVSNGTAFVWDTLGGVQFLPQVAGASGSDAMGISDSGIIVGYYSTGSLPPFTKSAFIYIPGQGTFDLKAYLTSLNATNVPATLGTGMGISRDGKVIAALSSGFPYTGYVIVFDSVPTIAGNVPKNENYFFVGPNPVTKGTVNLVFKSENKHVNVSLADFSGRIIFNYPLTLDDKNSASLELKEINGNKVSPGIYFLSVITSGRKATQKLVIE